MRGYSAIVTGVTGNSCEYLADMYTALQQGWNYLPCSRGLAFTPCSVALCVLLIKRNEISLTGQQTEYCICPRFKGAEPKEEQRRGWGMSAGILSFGIPGSHSIPQKLTPTSEKGKNADLNYEVTLL